MTDHKPFPTTWWLRGAADKLAAAGHHVEAAGLGVLAEGIESGRIVDTRPTLQVADTPKHDEGRIAEAVNRFLCWRLPDDFAPDAGISFTPIPRHPSWQHDPHPVGTNLFTAAQAKAMFEHCLATQPAAKRDAQAGFQQRVAPWMTATFPPDVCADQRERGDRLLEEVLELLQAHGYDRNRVATLVDYVYGRPAGEPWQEVGGVMVTLAAFCLAAGLDMHDCGDAELARVWTKIDVIRAKQASKRGLHTPLPTPPAARRVTDGDVFKACADYTIALSKCGSRLGSKSPHEIAMRAALESFAQPAEGVPDKKHDGPCWRNSHDDCGC